MATHLERLAVLLDGRNARQVAHELGISASQLSRIRTGDRGLHAQLILRICEHFRVSSDWLLGIDDSPKEPSRAALLRADNLLEEIDTQIRSVRSRATTDARTLRGAEAHIARARAAIGKSGA